MEDLYLVEVVSNLREILNEERREADALRDSIHRDRAALAGERGRLMAVIAAAERGGVAPSILEDLRRIDRTIAGLFDF
ncbi:MAG: hypothetical protein ACLFTV_19750 [Desulfococcaceae bacterium]